jgi:hypothetical protein
MGCLYGWTNIDLEILSVDDLFCAGSYGPNDKVRRSDGDYRGIPQIGERRIARASALAEWRSVRRRSTHSEQVERCVGRCADLADPRVHRLWDRDAAISPGFRAQRHRPMRRIGAGSSSMSCQLRIVHESAGDWSVHGLGGSPVAHLPSLAASIDYARRECDEAPATIELVIDGFYAVVHQQSGWPREVVPVPFDDCRVARDEVGGKAGSAFRRWCDWVSRKRRD